MQDPRSPSHRLCPREALERHVVLHRCLGTGAEARVTHPSPTTASKDGHRRADRRVTCTTDLEGPELGQWGRGSRGLQKATEKKQKQDCPGLGRSLGDGGRSPVVVGQPSGRPASTETLVFLLGGAGPGFVLCTVSLPLSSCLEGRCDGWRRRSHSAARKPRGRG